MIGLGVGEETTVATTSVLPTLPLLPHTTAAAFSCQSCRELF